MTADDLVTTDVDRAVDAIRAGGLVAMPTETVYGLAADATAPGAVARIFEVKGRPADHPLIVHLASAGQLDSWASEVPDAALVLIDAAWPGPLTVILPRAVGVLDVVTGGHDTVGLRVPAHQMTLDLLERVAVGLAAPSANRFGAVSPTTAEHVLARHRDRLDPRRDAILDGGPCPIGVESTIVDCATSPPQILRAGGVPVEDVHRLLAGEVTAHRGRVGPAGCWCRTTRRVAPCAWSTAPTTRSRCAPAPSAPRSSTSPTISSSTHASSTPVSATPTTAGWPP
jgi:L-threonylcarbamoyladenylate synthase